MRTFIIKHTVYNYKELNDVAKENVRKYILKEFHTCENFTKYCEQDLKRIFGKNTNLKVEHSLLCCMKDCLNIYGTIRAKDIFYYLDNNSSELRELKNTLTEEEKITILRYAEYCEYICLPLNGTNSYSMFDCIDIYNGWINDLEYFGFKNFNHETIWKFENMTKEIFMRLSSFYKKIGYEYFYKISEDEVEEICDLCNYEFYANGTLFKMNNEINMNIL